MYMLSSLEFRASTDAKWAVSEVDVKSTARNCKLVGDNILSSKSKNNHLYRVRVLRRSIVQLLMENVNYCG